MNNLLQFETERLIIRPSRLDDAPFFVELLNTPGWLVNIGDRNVRTVADAEEYIQTRILSQFERVGYGNYVVERKEDLEKVGVSGLYEREGLAAVDIGFALLPAYEAKGYAFEATQRVKEAAFGEFGLHKILAITTQTNFPSQKLLKKLGMEFTKLINLPNDPEELMLFELEKADIL
ncbi:MAG: GNAT family N-acetyltransferase [Bacteroidota bacterium]